MGVGEYLTFYLLLDAIRAAAIPLEVVECFLHQSVQIHLLAELQLRVPLQDYGHDHQQLYRGRGRRRTRNTLVNQMGRPQQVY